MGEKPWQREIYIQLLHWIKSVHPIGTVLCRVGGLLWSVKHPAPGSHTHTHTGAHLERPYTLESTCVCCYTIITPFPTAAVLSLEKCKEYWTMYLLLLQSCSIVHQHTHHIVWYLYWRYGWLECDCCEGHFCCNIKHYSLSYHTHSLFRRKYLLLLSVPLTHFLIKKVYQSAAAHWTKERTPNQVRPSLCSWIQLNPYKNLSFPPHVCEAAQLGEAWVAARTFAATVYLHFGAKV